VSLRVLSLFSGIGGIDLGLERTGGFRTMAFCEVDPFCREVLAHHWPGVPIHDEVRRLTSDSLGGLQPDAIVGGFPCQPHSVAGKRQGQADERHLWPEFARLVREIRPRWVLAENVPGIRTTAADEVCGYLEAAGYTVWPLVVGADDVGAPHRRKRVWFVAHRVSEGRSDERSGGLLDGERPARRHDADGRGEWPVGEPAGAGLEGQRADAGEPQQPEPRDAGALADSEGGGWSQQGHGRIAGSRPGCDGTRWPARPGEPQHDWEEPRLAYGERGGRYGRETRAEGLDTDGPTAGRDEGECLASDGDRRDGKPAARSPEQPMGSAANGLSERLVRRANREALKAYGNSVVPQVVEAVGYAILAAEG
jgi:DNA (cytosine-5)-methyltransferase 1